MSSKREFRSGSKKTGRGDGGVVGGSPFSRSQILHLMKSEFARARRHGYPASCMLMQVDRLTQLIDMHGSQLRDQLRDQFIKLIGDLTRGHDQLGLMGEDRYLLILPHTGEEDASLVAGRVVEAFSELDVRVGGQALALSLSIGVAANEDSETMFFDTLLSQAEVALETAVAAGGGRVAVFDRDQAARQDPDLDPFA